MGQITQKQAVIDVTVKVLKERGVEYRLGKDLPIVQLIEEEDKGRIKEIIFDMFKKEEIEFREEFRPKLESDKDLKSYISGLVSNHHRKAKELNDNKTYSREDYHKNNMLKLLDSINIGTDEYEKTLVSISESEDKYLQDALSKSRLRNVAK
jgi:hypothetical protein